MGWLFYPSRETENLTCSKENFHLILALDARSGSLAGFLPQNLDSPQRVLGERKLEMRWDLDSKPETSRVCVLFLL
jgi:hypothetical protein